MAEVYGIPVKDHEALLDNPIVLPPTGIIG
jgi:hypothetical protein